MSLLSKFLGTENYSLSDSPMFQELIRNIKADNIDTEGFELYLDDLSERNYFEEEVHLEKSYSSETLLKENRALRYRSDMYGISTGGEGHVYGVSVNNKYDYTGYTAKSQILKGKEVAA